MALEIAILAPDGSVLAEVPMSADEHWKFLQAVPKGSLWNRIADYYRDAHFSSDEIASLARDLTYLPVARTAVSQPLERLCDMAIRLGSGLTSIAD